jgi:glutamate-ammonia-ligase adenylyltransferase
MGAPDFQSLRTQLEAHRAAVTGQFQAILQAPGGGAAPAEAAFGLEALWDTSSRLPVLREAIAGFGLGDDGSLASIIATWFEQSGVQRLDEAGRRRLQILVPRVLQGLSGMADRNLVLQRVLGILDAVGGRSVYFALLNENAAALERLLDICCRSAFLTRQIASFPLLLDELIDGRVLEELPTRSQFAEQLASGREHAPDTDPERQVERLRQFQRAATFRVALADLTGRLPLMHVSDRLTDIAELILEEAMSMAWQQLVRIHGAPMCGDARSQREAEVAVIGYGKLGGIELGYASDLDLVFLHDSAGEVQRTAGPKPIDNGVFFLRLGQRILHLLTLHSAAGRLYEVDMRLRPSGKGGLMVTQLAAFELYQKQEAWTWEHQALLRARAVAGARPLREAFERVRLDVLSHYVRHATLQEEVRRMRERMRSELSRSKAGEFDVKQDAGGLADIEFLAQYWALTWADRYPPLVLFSDTIRQLESVASANLVPQATVDVLTAAYRDYRRELHHRSLENAPAIVTDEHFAATRERVLAIWNATLPS